MITVFTPTYNRGYIISELYESLTQQTFKNFEWLIVDDGSSDETESSGMQKAIYRDGKIHWQGKEYNELSFTPQQGAPAFFELKDVTIGINFHWERKEVQKFKGELKIIIEGEQLTAINVISIEEYLTSVISSEMSATASLELLKAHAVISRSWLLNKLRIENDKLKNQIKWQGIKIAVPTGTAIGLGMVFLLLKVFKVF